MLQGAKEIANLILICICDPLTPVEENIMEFSTKELLKFASQIAGILSGCVRDSFPRES